MTTSAPKSLPEKQWLSTYAKELALMFAAYFVLLFASGAATDHTSGVIRYALAVTPVLPFATLGWIVLRLMARVDELQRALIYRAITFAFFGTSIVTFGYGFAETAGAPHLSMFAVWPVMGALWIVGRWIAPRMP